MQSFPTPKERSSREGRPTMPLVPASRAYPPKIASLQHAGKVFPTKDLALTKALLFSYKGNGETIR